MPSRARKIIGGVALAVLAFAGVVAPAGAADYDYACHSALSQSPTEYTVVGDVPDEVFAGETFELSDVVLTGTPSIDLYLQELTFELVDPIGATPVSSLATTWTVDGFPPLTPAGSTNSSPPVDYQFVATGPVGSTIRFFPDDVSSVVRSHEDSDFELAVTCERVSGPAFAETTIVERPPDAPEPPTSSASGDVLGTGLGVAPASVATPVSAPATFTG
jgi:hypothetical protein